MAQENSPKIYVISGPSCSGKGYLRRLILESRDLRVPVSYTTRPQRKNETDGIEYHFVSKEIFEEMIKNGEFLEYAEHPIGSGNYYGTSYKEMEKDGPILLELNIEGAKAIKQKYGNEATLIFIKVDEEVLKRRIYGLGDRNHVEERLETAKQEIAEAGGIFDHIILNNDEERERPSPAEKALLEVIKE